MEASVAVCQPSRPLRPCHPENLSKVRKTATKNKRAVFVSHCAHCVTTAPFSCCTRIYESTLARRAHWAKFSPLPLPFSPSCWRRE